MEPSRSHRGWENEPPHGPFVVFGSKVGLAQMRPDYGFTFFTVRRNRWSNSVSSRVSPCMPLRFIKRREWNGVMDNEQRPLWKDIGSKLVSGVFPCLCCYPSDDAHKPNMRCNNVWRPQTDLKMLAENTLTLYPHKPTRCCENGDGMCYRCYTVAIGSVIGSLLAQGPGDLSSDEKGVVIVIYGCCNPCNESPDVYPTPYFLLLKEPRPGILNLRRD